MAGRICRRVREVRSPCSTFTLPGCLAAFGEDRAQLSGFLDEPSSLPGISHFTLVRDRQPKLALIAFVQHNPHACRELCVRASATCTSVITCYSDPCTRELARKGIPSRRSGKRVNKLQNCNREMLRACFQVLGGFVHTRRDCRRCSTRSLLNFRPCRASHDIASYFLQSCHSAILQFPHPFCNPAILQSCNFL